MKPTKQRIICFVLLGLGVVALAVDKLFLAPAGASAAEGAAPASAPAAADSAPPPPAPAPAPPAGPALAQRLTTAAGGELSGRDGFRPSLSWVRPVGDEAPEDIEPPAVDAFMAKHKLSMIGVTKASAGECIDVAFIGGKTYRVGEMLDGFTLVSVDRTRRSVIFKSVAGEAVLTMPDPSVHRPEPGPGR